MGESGLHGPAEKHSCPWNGLYRTALVPETCGSRPLRDGGSPPRVSYGSQRSFHSPGGCYGRYVLVRGLAGQRGRRCCLCCPGNRPGLRRRLCSRHGERESGVRKAWRGCAPSDVCFEYGRVRSERRNLDRRGVYNATGAGSRQHHVAGGSCCGVVRCHHRYGAMFGSVWTGASATCAYGGTGARSILGAGRQPGSISCTATIVSVYCTICWSFRTHVPFMSRRITSRPVRSDVLHWLANEMDRPPPQMEPDSWSIGKRCSNRLLLRESGYHLSASDVS